MNPCLESSSCTSRAPSAKRSGRKQTSSVISVEPSGRFFPIKPRSPSRTCQASSIGLGDAREIYRLDQPGGTYEFEDFALCFFERVRVPGPNFDKQSSCFRIEGLPVGGRFIKGLTGRGQRRSDHQLDSGGAQADEPRNK